MTKLRKQRRKKTYKHNVNRKRLRNKLFSVGKVTCKAIENAWEKKKSVRLNMQDMGLAYDPNESLKNLQVRKELLDKFKPNCSNPWKEEVLEDAPTPCKQYVAEELEKDAKAPRVKLFRLPKGQVEWVTYLMDKYGQDYKAMARDKKNYYQETWRQLRAKVKRFMGIPEQYSKYLEKRGLLESEAEEESDLSKFELRIESDSD